MREGHSYNTASADSPIDYATASTSVLPSRSEIGVEVIAVPCHRANLSKTLSTHFGREAN